MKHISFLKPLSQRQINDAFSIYSSEYDLANSRQNNTKGDLGYSEVELLEESKVDETLDIEQDQSDRTYNKLNAAFKTEDANHEASYSLAGFNTYNTMHSNKQNKFEDDSSMYDHVNNEN